MLFITSTETITKMSISLMCKMQPRKSFWYTEKIVLNKKTRKMEELLGYISEDPEREDEMLHLE